MLKLIKHLNKKEVLMILIVFLLVIFQVWLDLKLPEYVSSLTVLIQNESGSIKDILINGGYMLLCAFGSLSAAVANGYIVAKISSSYSARLREGVFSKILNFSTSEIKHFQTGSLITRTTNDITQVEGLITMGAQLMLKAPITAVWAVSKILNKSLEWSLLTGGTVVILLITVIIIFTKVFPKFKLIQKLIDKLNSQTRENLTGIRVIRTFNAEEYQEDKFNEVNQDLTELQLYNQKKFAFMQPMMTLMMNLLTLGIFLIGAYLINNAALSFKISLFGDMVVFSSYAMQVIMSFLMLVMIFMLVPRTEVSAKRINEVLDHEISIKPGTNNKSTKLKGVVEFKDVSFKYPDADEYLLKNISFKALPGETVAFIGSTGSGKSTLINLVPRFYDVTDGEVLVDGINVKDYEEKTLNNKIGYVSQKAVIFKDSINNNIAYNKKVDKDLVKYAAKIAQANDFISKTEKKYETEVAQGGTNISGGQKQRISIARAIYKKPEILIFDDSFSALDYKTDLKLRTEIRKNINDATVLIVAQRIGTIINADKILVLENGKCVGIGNHKELMSSCDVYKEIAYSQLSKEELENA